MHSDENRKRKAAQTANTFSKKHKTDSPTTSTVAPTRPATRSISKAQSASDSILRRDPSPGPSRPTAHRTRSKTGALKPKIPSPSEERTPPSPSGLSQWVAEMARQKQLQNASGRGSFLSAPQPLADPTATASLSKKRRKALPEPPPKSEAIIVISSDEDDETRPRKRTRRHTTQINEIIDLSKGDTPPPRSRPTRLRPAPLPTPTPAVSPSTHVSPSKYLDLRRLSHSKTKPKSTPSRPQPKTTTGPWPLKKKLPPAPSPTDMRGKRQNDLFDDDDKMGSPASELHPVEVAIPSRKSAPTRASKSKSKSKSRPTPTTEPEPEHTPNPTDATAGGMGLMSELRGGTFEKGRMPEELRVRLQEEEEEDGDKAEDITPPTPPIHSIVAIGTTSNIIREAAVVNSPANLIIKTEDVEDTDIICQLSTPNLKGEEDNPNLGEKERSVIVKEEPQSVEPGLNDIWVEEQEQDDLEEAIFQSVLLASAAEAGMPLANHQGESQVDIEQRDGSSTVPTVPSPVDDVCNVREAVQPQTQVVLEAEKEETGREVEVSAKDTEVEKVLEEETEVPTRYPSCPPTPTPAPALDFDPYLNFALDQQEQDDLEEALFQSHLVMVYSPPSEDEDKFGMDEQEQNQGQDQGQGQVDVGAPPSTPTSDPYEEDVFIIEDLDDAVRTTNEVITLSDHASTDRKVIHQSPANDLTEGKGGNDEEATASLAKMPIPEFSLPLHPPCSFSCSVPTTTLANPNENTSSVFIAGQLTRRLFAQSCLPPKAKTNAVKPVEVEQPVVEMRMAKPVIDAEVQNGIETQKEEPLVEVPVQSEVGQVQSMVEEVLIQGEHEESRSPVVEIIQVQKSVEESQVQSGPEEIQIPLVLDADLPDVGKIAESANVVPAAIVSIPSLADENGYADLDMNVFPERTSDTVLGEDDVIGVAQEIEDEAPQVDSLYQTTADADMIKTTLQPEFEPPSSAQVEVSGVEATHVKVTTTTTEAFEKDPILSRPLHGSRVLLEIIQDVIKKPQPEPEVAPIAIQVEEAGGGIAHSPLARTSKPGPETLTLLEDDRLLSSPDGESSSSQKSSLEPFIQFENTDDDPSRRSGDVSPFSPQVSERTSEPHVEIEHPNDLYHGISSPYPRASTPEPSTHRIEDVIADPLSLSPSSRPCISTSEPLTQIIFTKAESVMPEQNEGASVALDLSPQVSPARSQTLTLEPSVTGEDNAISGTLEFDLIGQNVQLPPTPTSIENSPSQSLRLPVDNVISQQNPVFEEEQPCVQSTVSISDIPSVTDLDPQRRTLSNSGSESSLATLDDSPPPSTPLRSVFETYYIRSTSPDDDLAPDIYSKLTDIPSYPSLAGSDEDDDEYLLSLNFSYPDFDIVG
ncbi:hypothetical protein J132_02086 [Termitomyces sp. J132]|nr:hypothetical protein J132_02086 [Termitomyces sp. J132]